MQRIADKHKDVAIGGIILTILLTLQHLFQGFPVKLLLSVPAAFFSILFPENLTPIYALAILMAFDWLTGLAVAFKEGNVSSGALFSGSVKLIIYFMLMIAGYQASQTSTLLAWLPDVVYAYIALTEFVSITENASKLGYKTRLTSILARYMKDTRIFKHTKMIDKEQFEKDKKDKGEDTSVE